MPRAGIKLGSPASKRCALPTVYNNNDNNNNNNNNNNNKQKFVYNLTPPFQHWLHRNLKQLSKH